MDFRMLDHSLIGEAWTSAETYANLEKMCDLAPRFAGSPGGRAARDLILEKFHDYGLSDAWLEPFDFLAWTRGSCQLTLVEPAARLLRSAISLIYSPDADRLRAQVVDCGIGSEMEFASKPPEQLRGKAVMVTTGNPENRPSIHRREKYGRAVAAGAAAFLYVNHRPGLLAETGSLRPGRVAEIPASGIAFEEGWELARRCKQGLTEVELTIHNELGPGQGYHVVAEVRGQTQETILAGAHYDGHDISQGATDDATGTVIVLELARLLAPLQGKLRRTIRLVAFDAEELGVLGSTEYVRTHRADLGVLGLMINLDSAHGPVSTHGFATGGFKDTEAALRSCAKDLGYPLSFSDRVVTASDNFPFFLEGVPAVCMKGRAENPALGRGFGHTAADTLDKVAEVDIKASVMTIARMLVRLANYEGSLGARKNSEEIKQVLLDQELEKPLRAQDKWPFTEK